METGKKLIMVIKKKKNYFPRNVGENMKEKKDRILFNYFIIGFEIFIFICLEGMIYPVRNTDEYYWGGYQYFSFICLVLLIMIIYKIVQTISLKKGDSIMEYVTLSNGLKMPMVGFGVFRVPDKKECEESVYQAIKAGYRLIDTAAAYYNEDAVGTAVKKAIAEGICTREELFITSKLWVQDMMDYESAKKGIRASLEKSGLEYFDLYLLHQACGDYFSAWRAMEDAYKKGLLKAIGVSNFYPNILTNFCEIVKVKPVVNQVELHPYYTQEKALETMKYYNVVPEAWAPLGGGRYNPFEDEMLKGIAAKYNKSVGQVILRWNIQRGVIVIPKSTHVERIKENIDIFDFELNEEEMKQISSLDMGYSGSRAKHFEPDFVRMVLNNKIHD
jgi:diketogulonate reductase-like aldo/keto reductase